jgi:hypothetical protein
LIAMPARLGNFTSALLGKSKSAFTDAKVSDTNDWQLAVFPRDEAYCGATPTECAPFFGNAVSSTINHASAPPTILSASASSAFSSGAASHTPLAMK